MTEQKSRAQQLVGDVAPKVAELTDEVSGADESETADLRERRK